MSATLGNALDGVRCSIIPGSGNYHFRLSGCDDCDARDLGSQTLGQVEDLYHQGYVGQAMFEAYCHAWAISADRFGCYDNWREPPTDPEVVALVALLKEIWAVTE